MKYDLTGISLAVLILPKQIQLKKLKRPLIKLFFLNSSSNLERGRCLLEK